MHVRITYASMFVLLHLLSVNRLMLPARETLESSLDAEPQMDLLYLFPGLLL